MGPAPVAPRADGDTVIRRRAGRDPMLGRLLACALTLALLPSASIALAPPSLDREYAHGAFVVTEPIVVRPGETLTIRDATVWLDWRGPCFMGTVGYCQPQIEVLGGTLVIERSVVTTHAFDPANAQSGWAIVSLGGQVVVRDSELSHFRILGVQEGSFAPSSIERNAWRDGDHAILVSRGADARIADNVIERVRQGIGVRDASALVEGNVIRGATGVGMLLDATLVGEKAFPTLPHARENLIESSRVGLVALGGFPMLVEDNILRGNGVGAQVVVTVGDDNLHREAPVFHDNRLEDNEDGVIVTMVGAVRRPITVEVGLHGNSFTGTGCTDLEVLRGSALVTLLVDASGNWWGDAAGPQDRGAACPAVVGGATVAPWLTAAP